MLTSSDHGCLCTAAILDKTFAAMAGLSRALRSHFGNWKIGLSDGLATLKPMLTPSVSLIILAAAAFCSLALSLQQGPLMAVLGLIGGYTAPLWIGGSEPNYFLLAGYISAISVAATLLMQKVRSAWISPSIALPHVVWMLLLIESMPLETLFSWLAIYLSITLYLIFAVPRLGWTLNPRYHHCHCQE